MIQMGSNFTTLFLNTFSFHHKIYNAETSQADIMLVPLLVYTDVNPSS